MSKGVIALAVASFGLSSCTREPVPNQRVLFEVPSHFPPPVYEGGDYSLSEATVALGRKLFYDPVLSGDNSVSCGSCHAQVHAFADHNVALSVGVNGATGTRNTPALSNLAWYPNFMHDGGIVHLEIMPLAPITTEVEMNQPLSELMEELNLHGEYPALFERAFGRREIRSKEFFVALAHFQMTMVSSNSRYDAVQRGEGEFTAAELAGLNLFEENCSSCHQPPLFSDFSFANTGMDSIYLDAGRGRVTSAPEDSGAFRVPTLRNVELTYPYMHDGRFYSLEEVIDHYSDNLLQVEHLDSRIGAPMVFTELEKFQLIAFLKTLTDFDYLSDSRLSEP